jgi:outer membrane protein assembly factor BamB
MAEREWDFFVRRMATRPGLFALRLGGRGDVSDTHVDWVQERGMGNVPSPLLYRGVIYSIRDAGILSSLDAETGKVLKQGRLPQAMGAYHASPVAADGKLFLLDMEGTLTVVKAGAEWEVLHSLATGEGGSATPAIADGRLYVRTHKNLYCFGE